MPTVGAVVAIIEDDAAMRKSVERLLQASGFNTATFASAREFLSSDAATSASMLVLDIHLDGMSGLELQRQRLASGCTCPVVFMTAFDDEDTRKQAHRLGCTAYLLKPFHAHQLTDALRLGLGLKQHTAD